MAVNVNRVVLTGNLTHGPELHASENTTPRCRLRLAVNGRRKDGDSWQERPNYVNVTVWGALAVNCGRYLDKGRAVAVDGRLEWHEWQDKDGRRRESVEVVGESVQFLGPRPATPADAPPVTEPAMAGVAAGGDGGGEAPAASEDVPF